MANRIWEDIQQERRNADQALRESSRRLRQYCFHKDQGNGKRCILKSALEENRNLPKDTYTTSTVVCAGPNGCGRIFEGAVYTSKEADDAVFQLMSMVEQLKWNSKSEEEFPGGLDFLEDANRAVEIIDQVARIYKSVISDKERNRQNKNRNNGPKKGGFGVPKVYGTRSF